MFVCLIQKNSVVQPTNYGYPCYNLHQVQIFGVVKVFLLCWFLHRCASKIRIPRSPSVVCIQKGWIWYVYLWLILHQEVFAVLLYFLVHWFSWFIFICRRYIIFLWSHSFNMFRVWSDHMKSVASLKLPVQIYL